MGNSNKEKAKQLGMAYGTASGRLKKMLLYDLVSKTDKIICFRCGKKIDSIDNFSVEHKVPWLHSDNPLELFFDLENIAFSHSICNIRAARREKSEHPSARHYRLGCRCSKCVKYEKQRKKDMRSRGVNVRGKYTYQKKKK